MAIEYADNGDVRLAYESFGSADDPVILLVMGLGTQMLAWDEGFCELLVDGGYRVVRMDNRDIGLSTHLDGAGLPDMTPMQSGGLLTDAKYLLSDMAADTLAVVDALGADAVHVVGGSMGGMIAQEFALNHSDRTLSLTSIFSTPAPRIGGPTREAMAALMLPPPRSEDEAADRTVAMYRVVGSPGYPLDEQSLRERSREAYRRGENPAGTARQLAAIHASGDRSERLADLTVPTLVLHGQDDPLVRLRGGEATAEAVPGAKLVTYPGMGHDLPRELWPAVTAEILELADSTR